jgi:hypothetical protein
MKKNLKKLQLKKNTVLMLGKNTNERMQAGLKPGSANEECFSRMQRVCTVFTCDTCAESCWGSCGC